MRTGSNLLEEMMSGLGGVSTHGELFNPHFFGRPTSTSAFGISLQHRDEDPTRVLNAMKAFKTELPGFRLFSGHDPRVLDAVVSDENCAKIILRRTLIESFVSLQIAKQTGQWWLGDARSARSAKVTFDAQAYDAFVTRETAFYTQIDTDLIESGQTAFRLSYRDLMKPGTIRGLARFLGVPEAPNAADVRARVQNPTPIEDRLTNPKAAQAALVAEAADIGADPMREPGRGPGVKFFKVVDGVPLLYLPIRGAGDDGVPAWMRQIAQTEFLPPFSQRDLRKWKRTHAGHLSFTVLRHPLARAHDAFCRLILPVDNRHNAETRDALVRRYGVALPSAWPAPDWSLKDHQAAFLGFLRFLKANLGGQTSLTVDSAWATQERLLSAISDLVVPDRVFREDGLDQSLADLARDVGHVAPKPVTPTPTVSHAFPLQAVVTDDIEKAAQAAYRRDYLSFGFGAWRAPD